MNPDGTPATPATKPEGVPDKFWNAQTGTVDVAGMAKSYTEMERFASSRAAPPAAAPTPPPVSAPPAPVDPSASFRGAQALAEQELRATGKIAESTYQEFQRLGVPREAVDFQVQAITSQRAAAEKAVYDAAGGRENFDTMTAWGRVNLPADQQQSFNLGLQNADPAIRALVVKDLVAKYTAANGSPGSLVNSFSPAPPGSTGVQPYTDVRELTAEMRKPEYKDNPAFRKQVEQRLDATRRANIDLGLRVINGNTGQRIA